MTVQEAIEYVVKEVCEDCCGSDEPMGDCKTCGVKIALESMEEVEQYRALGTVEELKEAREKQIPQTPCIEGDGYCPEGNLVYDTWICPNCEEHYEIDYDDYDYCPKCGQAIDKSVIEGGEEE